MTQIPVFINVFNRLQWVQDMLRELARMPEAYPIIVDNDSTYPPLVEWYQKTSEWYGKEYKCDIAFLARNDGPRGAWNLAIRLMETQPNLPYFVITDPDLDLSECPNDTLAILKRGLDAHPDVKKVGLSLRLDDISDAYPWKERVISAESKFYRTQRPDGFWDAEIDTTFCMMRPGDQPFAYGPALRSPAPYRARHIPWYAIPGSMTKEDEYYLDSIPESHKPGVVYSTLAIDESHKLRTQVS